MGLTDKQIGEVLDRHVLHPTCSTWRAERLELHKKWTAWIHPDKIRALADQELRDHFLDYFNSGAGRHPFVAIYRDRIAANIPRLRKTIAFLIDSNVPLCARIDQVLNGNYKIEGFGKALATSILMDLDPFRYPTWNSKVEDGLTELGRCPAFGPWDSDSHRYLRFQKTIGRIRRIRPVLTFIELDHFFHLAAKDPFCRGSIARRAVSNKR
jgi:hypothetical protein